ncbi:hypothetical protein FOPG_19428 [Fusarium oxysporum f. sp. conglutinans race 2 54008]|uniref:Uncharacterized protein n=1 Tax=Fusarium oxysporum f. sp. conglutinans race 2 54008 TaxID=1089457 RepID=X0HT24_FUSOX|nr:hypothetical protein FOPG_19428 [Fusarium oxysporum f. sp. conglutinans race 2 54008]
MARVQKVKRRTAGQVLLLRVLKTHPTTVGSCAITLTSHMRNSTSFLVVACVQQWLPVSGSKTIFEAVPTI